MKAIQEIKEGDSALVRGAKNIRIELKKAFPQTKFSVRSERFSMGDAIRVSWENGPSDEAVEEITNKYVGSKFNAYEDYSEPVRTDFNERYGNAKYVTTSRTVSEGIKEEVRKFLLEESGKTVEEMDYGEKMDFDQDVWRLINSQTLPEGRKVVGVGSRPEVTCWTYVHQKYYLKFEEPEKRPALPEVESDADGITCIDTAHTKKGHPLYVAKFAGRVSKDSFKAALTVAKACGGYYSGYTKDGAVAGFQFKTEEDREEFVNAMKGKTPEPEEKSEPSEPRLSQLEKKAASLRKSAEGMEKLIDSKINNATAMQNPTPRRARIAAGMEAEGRQLQKVQALMLIAAEKLEKGESPPELTGINSRAAAGRVLRESDYAKKLVEGFVKVDNEALRIKELERSLIGSRIPGFFETLPDTIDKMLSYSNVEQGERVLEPNGGAGAILERLRERGIEATTFERSHTLRELLEAKGFKVSGSDFLAYEPDKEGRFDAIIMNPPFENGQDIEHIRHAYDCLKEGKRMVAISCNGPFFRQDRKSKEFRDWISDKLTHEEDLPENSFMGGRMTSTGVNAKLLVIDK